VTKDPSDPVFKALINILAVLAAVLLVAAASRTW
jgi:hypothetical protein